MGLRLEKVLHEPEYSITHNALSVTSHGAFGNTSPNSPMARSQVHFDNMKKNAKWTKNWDPNYQKDHFFEIHHVVGILVGGPLSQGKWLSASYEQYLHLLCYLNDQRNTWNIPASLNNRKGRIPLFQYIHPEETDVAHRDIEDAQREYLAEYLFCFTQNKTTPFIELIDLSIDMAIRDEKEVKLSELTKHVGERLFDGLDRAYIGWSVARQQPRLQQSDFDNYFSEMAKKRAGKKSSVLEFATDELVGGL
ncbi:MAG: hypothetical protein L6R41_005637 [Letrouitia leprolyta]|nr:MAG: hypothetical protein L6R41_005637 [Letrouitia leprolyta]